jgi:predicted amidohydrolase
MIRKPYLAAAIQMHSTEDKAANVARATELVEEAAERGAQLVVLPEFFNCLAGFEAILAGAEPIPGPTSEAMSQLAARLKITLLAGSICQQTDQAGKACNTSLLFGPDGGLLAQYKKIHLFDVHLPYAIDVTESDWIVPGDDICCTAVDGFMLGQTTCYDLRFPELFRLLVDRGADLMAVPSAFAQHTGRYHWEVLLRARAIENQAYVVASDQYGQHTTNLTTYGCSMIIDPWGRVLDRAGESGDAVVLAEIDPEYTAKIRHHLPALKHRRL